MKTITATFNPQASLAGHLIDIDGRQEVDATETVLKLSLEEIHELENGDVTTDELVDLDALHHAGPFYVFAVESICAFFGVALVTDITQADLNAARKEYAAARKAARRAMASAKPEPHQACYQARVKAAEAIAALRKARELLKEIGATKALDRVRSALKSAEGAQRNAVCKSSRALQAALG